MALPGKHEPSSPRIGPGLEAALLAAYSNAERGRHQACALEHLLQALLVAGRVGEILGGCGANLDELERELSDYLALVPELAEGSTDRPAHDPLLRSALESAWRAVRSAGRLQVDEPDLLASLLRERDAYAAAIVGAQGVTRVDVLRRILHGAAAGVAYRIAPPTGGAPHAVVLHDNPYTTMDFVVATLSSVFELPASEAKAAMLAVHEGGRGRIAVLAADLACERATRAMRAAEEAGFPLRLTVEPA